MAVILQNDYLTGPEYRWIDYISGASQLMVNILVSTFWCLFSVVRNPIKNIVLDHYNMFKHTQCTFQLMATRYVYGSLKIQMVSQA